VPELWTAFKQAILPLMLPVFLLGAIVSGLTTATEAGVIGVVYALILGGLVYREYTFKELFRILVESAINSAIPLFVVATTAVAAWIIAVEEFPATLVDFFDKMAFGPVLVLLTINLFLMTVGMFMDLVPALILFAPILLPVVTAVGVDPVHFGTIMVVNLGIGLVTPPVGNCLYLGAVLAKVDLWVLVRASAPFLIMNLLALAIVTYVPQVSLFLPSLFYR
jgi:C4-dicarboxylate transporter DctM subunit